MSWGDEQLALRAEVCFPGGAPLLPRWRPRCKAKYTTRTHAHLRLARLKLLLKVRHSRMASCSTTSCCTRGVAVAVSAISGTAGYLCRLLVWGACVRA